MRFPCSRCAGGVLFVAAMAFSLSSCALLRPPEGEEGEAEAPPEDESQPAAVEDPRVFLGQITMVNQESGFVLIRSVVNPRLEAGWPLQSFNGADLSAELLFSPEQSSGFMTADISHGTPVVGDTVYLRYTEDFPGSMSPRMQRAMEQFEHEQNMSFFERRKYEREQKRAAKEKAKARAERERNR